MDETATELTFADLLPTLHIFRNRVDAGAELAQHLEEYRGRDPLILGIPRGGVPVAAEIAHRLDAELDIVVARKLGAPFQPELAIGAVTANGGRYLNDDLIEEAGVTADFLQAVISQEMAEAHRREARFRGNRAPPTIEGRTVIVVDDGLATGATMRAAVRSLRKRQPARVVVAIPVGPPDTCAALRAEADEVIALYEPKPFLAVGLHYQDFRPTDEREVEQLLLYNWQKRPGSRDRKGRELQ